MKKYDEPMMKTAHIFAEQSYCNKRKVGAVLSKNGRILATGYNGTIAGQPNECESIHFECPKCGKIEPTFDQLFNVYTRENSQRFGELEAQAVCKHCEKEADKNTLNVRPNSHSVRESRLHHIRGEQQKLFTNIHPVFKTSEFTLHAEQNIITYCAKNGIPTEGTTLHVTTSPCKQCAKLIAQSGITQVVYDDIYKDEDGIAFLEKAGVKIYRLE